MSISATYFIDRKITRAARELDLIVAGQQNKVPKESAKLRSLKGMLEAAAARFHSIAASSGLPDSEFAALAWQRMRELRQAQFDQVKRLRDARAQAKAERDQLIADGVIPA